jgi:hypothetical protein
MFRLAAAVFVSGLALSAAQRPGDDNAFPRTKFHGRATVEYEDEQVKAVAIYDYSQRNHKQAWLLVQFGVALYERAAVRRESFHLIMPGGRSVPLATQEQFLADAARIRQFRQNAGIFHRDLVNYFPKSAVGDVMRWVALPGWADSRAGGDSRRAGRRDWRSLLQVTDAAMGVGHASARLRSRKGPRRAADTPRVMRTNSCSA